MGKGQVQSSPELGHELEFNRTSRHAAVSAIAWKRSIQLCKALLVPWVISCDTDVVLTIIRKIPLARGWQAA